MQVSFLFILKVSVRSDHESSLSILLACFCPSAFWMFVWNSLRNRYSLAIAHYMTMCNITYCRFRPNECILGSFPGIPISFVISLTPICPCIPNSVTLFGLSYNFQCLLAIPFYLWGSWVIVPICCRSSCITQPQTKEPFRNVGRASLPSPMCGELAHSTFLLCW